MTPLVLLAIVLIDAAILLHAQYRNWQERKDWE